MALAVQLVFLSVCLAILQGANSQTTTPPAITCCMSLPPTPTSPCYVTTTAAPITCPFMTTTTPSTKTPTTTETPTTTTSTEKATTTTIAARQPDPNQPSSTDVPLTPNFVVVPNYPIPAISTPPLNYPIAAGVPGFNTTGLNPSNLYGMQPYPILRSPYIPIVTDPSTGQGYYVVPNPNLRGNSYSQILNVYNQDKNTGGYYLMPAALLPQPNNNATTENTSSDKN